MSAQQRRDRLLRVLGWVAQRGRALSLIEIKQLAIYDHVPPDTVVLADLLQLLSVRRVAIVPCSLPVRWEAV